MNAKVNYTVVGVFVVGLTALLIFFVLWLTALRSQQVYHTYVTYITDDVSGLSVQGTVKYNGVSVGYVQSMELSPLDPQKVRLALQIAEGTPILTSTRAMLMSEGITGVSYVGLKALTPKAPLLKPAPGQRFPVIPSQHSLLVQLSKVVQRATDAITDISKAIQDIASPQNQAAISHSLQNIETLTNMLSQQSDHIADAIISADTVLKQGVITSRKFPKMVEQIEITLQSVEIAARSAASMTDRTGQTVQNLGPAIQSAMVRMNQLEAQFQVLLEGLQRNPAMLVRGREVGQKGPGE